VTAWSALSEFGQVTVKDSLLIHGSGGVGLMCLMLAKAIGARCIMTTSGEDKAQRLLAMGADGVVLRTSSDWPVAAMDLNGGKFDRVLELGGAATLNASVRCTRPGGVVILIGNVSGSRVDLDLAPILTRRLLLAAVSCGPAQSHRELAAFLETHQLRPLVQERFAFGAAPNAFAALRHGNCFGKLCISIGDSNEVPKG